MAAAVSGGNDLWFGSFAKSKAYSKTRLKTAGSSISARKAGILLFKARRPTSPCAPCRGKTPPWCTRPSSSPPSYC